MLRAKVTVELVRRANLPADAGRAGDRDRRLIVPQVDRAQAAHLEPVVQRVPEDAAKLAHRDRIRVDAPVIGREGVDHHAVA